jgi:hypothetical protein
MIHNENITPYKILSNGVIKRWAKTPYPIPNMTERQLDEMIFSYIDTVCVRFKACKKDLTNRDSILERFNVVLDFEEQDILIRLMFIECLECNFINVPSLLREHMGTKDMSWFSKKNHLDGLEALRDRNERRVNQMISAYSNQGSDLFASLRSRRGISSSPEATVPSE